LRRKEITGTLYVSIDGVDVLWDTLTLEQKTEISDVLNKRAVKAALLAQGFTIREIPVQK
jgi:hypothetical protein